MSFTRSGAAALVLLFIQLAAPAQSQTLRSAILQPHGSSQGLRPVAFPADSLVRKNPTGAMLRSAALPGWGQLYNEQKWKAALAVGIQGGIIAHTIWLQGRVNSATTPEDRAVYVDKRNTNYWRYLAVTLISMLDAYVDAHLYAFDEGPELGANSASTAVGLRVQVPF